MKHLIVVSVFCLLFSNLVAQIDLTGKWKNEETGDIVEMYKQNDYFFGKIHSVANEDDRSIIGHIFFRNIVYFTKKNIFIGSVNSPNGMTADLSIKIIDNSHFQLTVKKLFIEKQNNFIKVN